MKTRYYQDDAREAIWEYFKAGGKGNPVLALPTGTGKSVIIADFVRSVFYYLSNQRILVLAHRKELIGQNAAKLRTMWPSGSIGVYSSALNKRDTRQAVIFAGIDSVMNRPTEFGKIDLVIIDEAHLVDDKPSSRYMKFLSALITANPKLKIIGFSATPWRPKIGYIWNGGVFTDCCYDVTKLEDFNRLIDEGFLCPLVTPRTEFELDVDGVSVVGDEYVQTQLASAVDRIEITRRALEEAVPVGIARNRKSWLVFGVSIDHCEHICRMLNEEFDIPAVVVHSRQSGAVNDRNIADFKKGKYRALVNMGKLTTGFDHPAIDMIIMLRPTLSSSLWVQMLGRGTRPYDPEFPGDVDASVFDEIKLDCLVFDFARNARKLGPINDPIIPGRSKGGNGQGLPVKDCPMCGIENHAAARFCGGKPTIHPDYKSNLGCGHEFVFATNLYAESASDKLIADSVPEEKSFKVSLVSYSKHQKDKNRPATLMVSYTCGVRTFKEYICVEHPVGSYPRKRASDWWKARSGRIAPATVDDALHWIDELKRPTHIMVVVNQKYPEIKRHDFTGTNFGLDLNLSGPATEIATPDVEVAMTGDVILEQEVVEKMPDYLGADIPW